MTKTKKPSEESQETIQMLARPIVDITRRELIERIQIFTKRASRAPGLAVILVGDNPASVIYTSRKSDLAEDLGIKSETFRFSATASAEEVKAGIAKLDARDDIDGILLQRPLPPSFHEEDVITWISPEKDVDAFHPLHVGALSLGLPCFTPCTPLGIMKLLRHYQISLRGKVACVVGRSALVGKPMAALLLREDATVIHCHSKTRDLQTMTRQADILIVAAGSQGLIHPEHLKNGAVVVDVGIHRKVDGKVTGDVDFLEVVARASPQAITPVPGGVGPMTILSLMSNTLEAAERRIEGRKFAR
jgi:methylenetetrahydrofolate dehydrogenase (NADP+)/methenyltetrahydrofolate cyclohydrolase